MCGSAPAAVTTDGKARSRRRGVPAAGTSTSRSRRLPVFWDELERIDRNLNSGSILCQRKLRAYYEFRDRSEPVEKVAHTRGPCRAEASRMARRLVCGDRPVRAGRARASLPGGTEPWRFHNEPGPLAPAYWNEGN